MYCSKCGNEIEDSAKFCPKCGEKFEKVEKVEAEVVSDENTLKMVAFIFAVIACVCSAAALIPLCWTIPMTVKIYKAYKGEVKLSTGFKVCSLIFLSLVSGILLLVDQD